MNPNENPINPNQVPSPQPQLNLKYSTLHEPPSKTKLAAEPSKLKTLKTRLTQGGQESDEDLVYERIKNSRFKQQRLPAWRPVPNICSIIIVFALFALLFIILGIVLLVYSNKVKSVEVDYTDCALNSICNKQIKVDNDIDQPVFVYYQLNGFFQNSRRYLKSREVDQLTGDDATSHDDCEPAETNGEMGFDENRTAIDGVTPLNKNSIAIPCGLVAKTFFNDSFKFSINNQNISVDETNIAFNRDKKLYDTNPSPSQQWTDMTNEHFLVWMRPSGMPNPKKLWGRIERDLKEGEVINVEIDNRYKVSHYNGEKKIVLSNATKFGGKNKILGISFIIVGCLSILCGIIFAIAYRFQMQKEKTL